VRPASIDTSIFRRFSFLTRRGEGASIFHRKCRLCCGARFCQYELDVLSRAHLRSLVAARCGRAAGRTEGRARAHPS
jgi:hypothetical protein